MNWKRAIISGCLTGVGLGLWIGFNLHYKTSGTEPTLAMALIIWIASATLLATGVVVYLTGLFPSIEGNK